MNTGKQKLPQKPRVFISHAWEDKPTVYRLEEKLRQAGAEVWVDHSAARAGDNLPKRISEALAWCSCLLLVWSEHAEKSHWVELEWSNAVSLRKLIIPCLLDGRATPPILASTLHAPFKDFDLGLQQICAALGMRILAREPVVETPVPKSENPPPNVIPAQAGIQKTVPLQPIFRTESRTLSEDDVEQMLARHGFFDSRKNSSGKGFDNDFKLIERQGKKLVLDRASGLTWQQSGSSEYLNYKNAEAYVKDLNKKTFAGYRDWRLPTLEEAMSLMEPQKNREDLYIAPVFDAKQEWIWTADKASPGAWPINFINGCPDWFTLVPSYVRAVRS